MIRQNFTVSTWVFFVNVKLLHVVFDLYYLIRRTDNMAPGQQGAWHGHQGTQIRVQRGALTQVKLNQLSLARIITRHRLFEPKIGL
jgi:hypothetical protein